VIEIDGHMSDAKYIGTFLFALFMLPMKDVILKFKIDNFCRVHSANDDVDI